MNAKHAVGGVLVAFVAALLLAPLPAAGEGDGVKVWEGELTLPTYPWYDDVNPMFADLDGQIYYPYTRQDLISSEKGERTYRALFLENEYLKVTVLPELGGRVFSVLDKTTGGEVFHKNGEIKPALIAMRGAWISGGIEWNAGPQGHTVTVVSPVDTQLIENKDGSASVVVGNTEQMFRTRWTVNLTLLPGKAYLDESISIYNPTDGTHPYYFWNCTAFPNLPGTRFIYPMTLGSDHAGTTFFSWPVNEGVDLSWLKNYPTMSSVFAYDCVFDFFGSYDVDLDRGLVSYANHHELKGKKAWTWGKDDFGVVSQMSLSDAGPVNAQYIEVQSGPLLTQADYGMLGPCKRIAWREYWYSVHGLGEGFEYATRDAAVQAIRQGDALELRIIATGVYPGAVCRVTRDGKALAEQRLDLSPAQAQAVTVPRAADKRVKISVTSAAGETLLAYESPLDIPEVAVPDLTKKPARADGVSTAEEEYLAGWEKDSQSDPAGARAGYEAALAKDPLHIPSLLALATLEIENARIAEAMALADKALRRDPDCGMAWYLRGVAALNQGDLAGAVDGGYRAEATLDVPGLGLGLVGRANMLQHDYAAAADAFARALAGNPSDPRMRNSLLAAQIAAGQPQEDAATLLREDPLDFTLRAVLAGDAFETLAADVMRLAGEKEFTVLEAARFFAGLGLYEKAIGLLKATCAAEPPRVPRTALSLYYLAYYEHLAGEDKAASASLKRAAKESCDFVMPAYAESLPVFAYAISARPRDAHAHLLLGHVLAGLRRMDEAVPHWRKAVEIEPGLSVGWRLLGMFAWKKQNCLPDAEKCFRKAIAARPEDQVTYYDLARVLDAQARRGEAITLVAGMPHTPVPRYDVGLWLADAYLKEKQYDACLEVLSGAKFQNWEGATGPHDLFEAALLGRGKGHFESGDFEGARADFALALTYPENLGVGAKYALTDAEVRYWLGKALLELGRKDEARTAWETGAAQPTSKGKPLPFIACSAAQDEHVQRCAEALKGLEAK